MEILNDITYIMKSFHTVIIILCALKIVSLTLIFIKVSVFINMWEKNESLL